MGLFSALFGSRDSVEDLLVRQTAAYLQSMGMSLHEADDAAGSMLLQAKQEVVRRGWNDEPPNLGDWLLENEINDSTLRMRLDALRAEGVRDDDIREWWNQPALVRVSREKDNEFFRGASFYGFMSQGMTPELAGQRAKQAHPVFGDPNTGQGDHRPLPIELMPRVTALTERHYSVTEQW